MGRAQRTLRFDCSPTSNTCTDGKAGAFRLRRDERVEVRSRWFLSDPGPARARIQNYGVFLSDNELYIKVKRMVYLSGRSDFKTRRNNCAAQPSELLQGSDTLPFEKLEYRLEEEFGCGIRPAVRAAPRSIL